MGWFDVQRTQRNRDAVPREPADLDLAAEYPPPPDAAEEPALAARMAALERATFARLAAERGTEAWLRSQSRGLRLGAWALLGTLEAGLLLGVAPPTGSLAGAVEVALAGVLCWHGLRPLYWPPLGRTRVGALLALALVVPAVAALAAPAGATPNTALTCFARGLALAAPPFAAARLLDRSGGAGREARHLLPAASGLLGTGLLAGACHDGGAPHLLAGHATVVLSALLLGRWFTPAR